MARSWPARVAKCLARERQTFAGELLRSGRSTSGRGCGASASSRSIGSCSTAAPRPSPGMRSKSWSKAADEAGLTDGAPSAAKNPSDLRRRDVKAQLGQASRPRGACSRSTTLREELEKPFRETRLLLAATDRAQGRSGRRRNGPRAAGARLEQHLHAADHQSHRNALDRRAHRHRRQGVRPGPGYDRPRLQGDRSGAEADQRRPRRASPRRSWARATCKSTSTASRRPATASRSKTFRTRSKWPWPAGPSRSPSKSAIAFRSAFATPAPTARTKRAFGGCWSAPAAWRQRRRRRRSVAAADALRAPAKCD